MDKPIYDDYLFNDVVKNEPIFVNLFPDPISVNVQPDWKGTSIRSAHRLNSRSGLGPVSGHFCGIHAR